MTESTNTPAATEDTVVTEETPNQGSPIDDYDYVEDDYVEGFRPEDAPEVGDAIEMSDEEFLAQGGISMEIQEPGEPENSSIESIEVTADDDNNLEVTVDNNEPPKDDTEQNVFDNKVPDTEVDQDQIEEDSKKDPDTIRNKEAEWAELFEQPIKAAGGEFKIETVDDAKKLIQKGLGYNRGMAEVAPLRRVGKMLEKAKLLDEQELSYLIDLRNGDKTAIAKLLKDNGIDPVETDWEETSDYKNTGDHLVQDEEIALEDVFESIQHSPAFSSTLDLVTKGWDVQSRNALYKDPQRIVEINTAKENGVFDVVMQQVQYQRSLGNLNGISDLEAYAKVGKAMNEAAAKANEGVAPQNPPATTEQPEPNIAKTEDKTQQNQQRRAASLPRSAPNSSDPQGEVSPLELSDDEYKRRYGGGIP